MKRVIIRIIFEEVTLKEVAKLEVQLEKLLKDYGRPSIEITAVSTPESPLPPE